jgi:hypothetical protein
MSLDGVAFARRQRHVRGAVCTVENDTRRARAVHLEPKALHLPPSSRGRWRTLAKRVTGVDCATLPNGFAFCILFSPWETTRLQGLSSPGRASANPAPQ